MELTNAHRIPFTLRQVPRQVPKWVTARCAVVLQGHCSASGHLVLKPAVWSCTLFPPKPQWPRLSWAENQCDHVREGRAPYLAHRKYLTIPELLLLIPSEGWTRMAGFPGHTTLQHTASTCSPGGSQALGMLTRPESLRTKPRSTSLYGWFSCWSPKGWDRPKKETLFTMSSFPLLDSWTTYVKKSP